MELRDWQRPKPTSIVWLFVFAFTVPAVRTAMEVFLHRRPFRWQVEWTRASTIVGVLAGVIFFLAQYLSREKHAWNALESKLRQETFVAQELREQIAALHERVHRLERALGHDEEASDVEG